MISYLPIWILFAHWISDFIFQTRWMGNNKSSDWNAMAAHIVTYTVHLFVFVLIAAAIGWTNGSVKALVLYVVLNGLAHLATDIISSRLSKKAYKEGREHDFWAIIGADQFAHTAVLLATLPLIS